jgi:O-6-methylguanine DNA methyltransferase
MSAAHAKTETIFYSLFPSLVGNLHIATLNGAVISIGFDQRDALEVLEKMLQRYVRHFGMVHHDEAHAPIHSQLEKYFNGSLRKFTVKTHLFGTDFQLQVWTAIRSIPYGSTVTYKHIANTIGNPDGMRAVGQATGRNPIPIIIPCHRVIGEDGTLVGFGGGIENKKKLLRLEGSLLV